MRRQNPASDVTLRCLVILAALGLCSSVEARRVVTPIVDPTSSGATAAEAFFHMDRVPTSSDDVYLSNVACVLGIFGKEMRYTIVKGSLHGNPRKMLFVRTYRTDKNGYMRTWPIDNYRWHPFNAGSPEDKTQRIELGDDRCDQATHIETAIVRGQQPVPGIVRCVAAPCAETKEDRKADK